jgi:protein-S-isoprenylcysteine O-methyltransferase Ste14
MYPPMYLGLSILLMYGFHRFAPVKQLIGWPARYAGLVPIVFGLWIGLTARIMFARIGTTIKPFQESSKLATDGPFRFSRNPIYLSMTMLLVGFALLLGSLTPFLVIPAFFLVIDKRFVPVEEAMLAQTFGAEFDAYRSRVRRWL